MKSKILIVEDETKIEVLMRARLNSNGYEVLSAADGEEGVRKAIEENPDLILLDLVLPRKDGFEMLKELKANKKTEKIPVIILSAMAYQKDMDRAKALGAYDYITKPFDPPMLLKKLENALIAS